LTGWAWHSGVRPRPHDGPMPGNIKMHRSAGEGGADMPTYVSLINWTEQGIKNFRDTTQRAVEFSRLVESSGGRVRELLWTVGEYDIVCVAEFPDDETGVAALLRVGSAGNIRSNTLRAFSAEEMAGIIARAG
jgi:uncharacterized protein with GYD domain